MTHPKYNPVLEKFMFVSQSGAECTLKHALAHRLRASELQALRDCFCILGKRIRPALAKVCPTS
jgi:hypothetical protein